MNFCTKCIFIVFSYFFCGLPWTTSSVVEHFANIFRYLNSKPYRLVADEDTKQHHNVLDIFLDVFVLVHVIGTEYELLQLPSHCINYTSVILPTAFRCWPNSKSTEYLRRWIVSGIFRPTETHFTWMNVSKVN